MRLPNALLGEVRGEPAGLGSPSDHRSAAIDLLNLEAALEPELRVVRSSMPSRPAPPECSPPLDRRSQARAHKVDQPAWFDPPRAS